MPAQKANLLCQSCILTKNQQVLQIFRNNSPFTVIILFIAALCLKLNVLLHPIAPMPIQGYLVYNTLLSGINVVLDGNAFGYTLITVVMLFTQALYINNIAVSYKLFNRPTYITAAVFLLLTSLYPAVQLFWYHRCCQLAYYRRVRYYA